MEKDTYKYDIYIYIYPDKNIFLLTYLFYLSLLYFTLLYSLLTLSIISLERRQIKWYVHCNILLKMNYSSYTRINKHSINFNLFDIEGEQEAKKKKESVQKDV